jgi:hypothetical protein
MYSFPEARLSDCLKEIRTYEQDIVKYGADLAEIGMREVIEGYVDGLKSVVSQIEGLELPEDAYYDIYLDLYELDLGNDYQRGKTDGIKFALRTLGNVSVDRLARI